MIQEIILKLTEGQNLTIDETMQVMRLIMSGQATNAQIAAFITAIRIKGESIDEITACAKVLREKCKGLQPKTDVLDIVGTGGDCANTFNISTTSAFVIAAAGVAVAKHGNRSVSSKCGSADVLEALGVKLELSVDQSSVVLEKAGICFLFAPLYHSSMRFAAPVRKELGIRTLFNIIGPLANPAGANMQLLGVYDENLVEPLARVLANLGVKHAMVVHGHDGLDEASLASTSTICEINEGRVNSFFLEPKQLGFTRCQAQDLVGGDAKTNAQITLDILTGKEQGAKRDAVLLNSALCIYMAKNANTLRECVNIAREMIDSGRAKNKLDEFVQLTNIA